MALVVAGRCARCARQQEQQRPNAASRAWYHTLRWRTLRTQVLHEEPLCRHCLDHGETTASREVDHIVPHHGDEGQFWSRANLQGLCSSCHSRKTRRGA